MTHLQANNKEMILEINALKGFAIFLVILGHTIYFIDQTNANDNLVFKIIYTFHVPLFFFISGYLAYGRFGPTTLIWIKKKFVGLIIPYIIFTLTYDFIFRGFSLSEITIEKVIYSLFAYTKLDSAWFLPVLFESLVVLSFIINIEKIMSKKFFALFFLLFIVLFPLIPVNSIPGGSQVVYYTHYVTIGYYICKYRAKFEIKNDMGSFIKNLLILIGAILFPVLFSLLYSVRLDLFFNDIYFAYISYIYFAYIVAFTGFIFSYLIIKLVSKSKIFSFLALFGTFSLELYLIHLIVLFYSAFLDIPLWFGSGILEILSGTLIVLTLSLSISYILSYNEKISKFLFRRWSSKYAPKNIHQFLYALVFTILLLYIFLNIATYI